jgi:tetratricopeptide (TPR) repeat protein
MKIINIYIILFLFLAVHTNGQEKRQAISDFDDAYKQEIMAENTALTERISSYPQEFQEENKKIGQAIRENDDKKALEIALDLNKKYPKNADLKNFIGKLRTKSLEYEEATQFFDEAIEIDSKNKWFYINKVAALAENNKFEEALKTVEKLNSLFPNWSIGYNFKAALLYELNKQSEALKAYEMAINLEPKSAQILTNRGDLFLELSKEKNAVSDYKRALEIQPNYERARERLKTISQKK